MVAVRSRESDRSPAIRPMSSARCRVSRSFDWQRLADSPQQRHPSGRVRGRYRSSHDPWKVSVASASLATPAASRTNLPPFPLKGDLVRAEPAHPPCSVRAAVMETERPEKQQPLRRAATGPHAEIVREPSAPVRAARDQPAPSTPVRARPHPKREAAFRQDARRQTASSPRATTPSARRRSEATSATRPPLPTSPSIAAATPPAAANRSILLAATATTAARASQPDHSPELAAEPRQLLHPRSHATR